MNGFRFTDKDGGDLDMNDLHAQLLTVSTTMRLRSKPDELETVLAFVCAVAAIPRAQLGPHEVKASALLMMARQLLQRLGVDEKKRAAVMHHVTKKNEQRQGRR